MKIAYLSPFFAVAAYFIPRDSIEPLARIAVPSIALMSTSIFPCMTLVVNAMKGEQRTPALVEDLYAKLRLVLKLLVVTFALAAAAMISLAAAVVLLDAPVLPWVPKIPLSVGAAIIILFMGRIEAIGRAFFALLDINRKHALLIARGKVRTDRDAKVDAIKAGAFPADDLTPRKLQRVDI